LLEFVKILKTKAKLSLEISHLILEKSILSDGYEEVIKETFSTIFKIPTVQRMLKNAGKDSDSPPEICTLLSALLDQSKHIEEQNKLQSGSKQTTHSLIIRTIMRLPMNKVYIFNSVNDKFKEAAFVSVLNEILDHATDETNEKVMNENTMFMRSILIASAKTEIGIDKYFDIIKKLIKKGPWKFKLQWSGVKLFLKQHKNEFTDRSILEFIPEVHRNELINDLEAD